ncbi:MAG: transcriptional regulator [Bacteroidetes bacterium QS_7_67_15]|jgi:nitrogen regulatory protein P-II 1|nr:MAG: transcriptional regulator [Bacteroidetes bacterium QH_9_67_14]PSQ82510.1 MAG: transcriptional regulator [Bacteroidetes bacterium QS_7_67_15]PSQ93549.1 MAG: transcriptional regulator [Bacteroidetes bacterium SW_4_67_19]
MKLIKAIIRPDKLHDVLHALYEKNVQGLTVSRVKGHGGEPEVTETYRGAQRKRELQDKVLIDIALSEDFVETTVETIMETARTGEVGDGKVFIQPLDSVHRIRTGEQDEQAVTPVDET